MGINLYIVLYSLSLLGFFGLFSIQETVLKMQQSYAAMTISFQRAQVLSKSQLRAKLINLSHSPLWNDAMATQKNPTLKTLMELMLIEEKLQGLGLFTADCRPILILGTDNLPCQKERGPEDLVYSFEALGAEGSPRYQLGLIKKYDKNWLNQSSFMPLSSYFEPEIESHKLRPIPKSYWVRSIPPLWYESGRLYYIQMQIYGSLLIFGFLPIGVVVARLRRRLKTLTLEVGHSVRDLDLAHQDNILSKNTLKAKLDTIERLEAEIVNLENELDYLKPLKTLVIDWDRSFSSALGAAENLKDQSLYLNQGPGEGLGESLAGLCKVVEDWERELGSKSARVFLRHLSEREAPSGNQLNRDLGNILAYAKNGKNFWLETRSELSTVFQSATQLAQTLNRWKTLINLIVPKKDPNMRHPPVVTQGVSL